MRHWYLDCLAVIYGEVRNAPFTLSTVRPAIEARQYRANGSVLKELCHNGYMQRIPGEDLRVKGTHYVHQYRITGRGRDAAQRRAWASPAAVAEC
jgi:hypothetical protein